jgi:hypothetical protein
LDGAARYFRWVGWVVLGVIIAPTKWALVIARRRDYCGDVLPEGGWKKVDWWRHAVNLKNDSVG